MMTHAYSSDHLENMSKMKILSRFRRHRKHFNYKTKEENREVKK